MAETRTYRVGGENSMPSAVVEVEHNKAIGRTTAIVVFVHQSCLGNIIRDGKNRPIKTGDSFILDHAVANEAGVPESLRRAFDRSFIEESTSWWNGKETVAVVSRATS